MEVFIEIIVVGAHLEIMLSNQLVISIEEIIGSC